MPRTHEQKTYPLYHYTEKAGTLSIIYTVSLGASSMDQAPHILDSVQTQ